MVPMRDGVKLETAIFTPKNATRPLPFLFQRGPYGIPPDERFLSRADGPNKFDPLVEDGYIFVLQNLRGRFKSEGTFVMLRPPRDPSDPRAIDETTDAYDTIEWLLHNVPNNNGRAGMTGISYAGWTAVMATLQPHPALKAISAQASSADQFIGDDFHHNGAFRLSYSFEYAVLLEQEKQSNSVFQFDRFDLYDFYLSLGSLANVNARHFHDKLATWNDFVQHPNRDDFWDRQSFAPFLKKATVPNLNVTGWWDQEDFYGAVKIYDLCEPSDSERRNFLVAGPWNHGSWDEELGRKLGDIDFGSDTGTYFRAKVQAPWFAYWLHGKGKLEQPEALVFETGSNKWRSFDSWPPRKEIKATPLYLRAQRGLSFTPPPPPLATTKVPAEEFDSYVSDPENPVPHAPRPIREIMDPVWPTWPTWQVQDQRFADHRPDVLSFETEVLDHDVVIAGDIIAELHASTTGSDSDWIVKLIDVFPTPQNTRKELRIEDAVPQSEQPSHRVEMRGFQLMVAGEVLRGRFRNSFAKPEPIPSDQIVKYSIDLHTNSHAFLKGHRIMVQVQSTWFPVIDRNPQKYVDNIFKARPEDFIKATQKIWRSAAAPSAIILPIVTATN